MANQSRLNGGDFDFDVAGEDLGHKGVAWDTVGRYDAVFFHRPCRPDDLTIIRIAKNMNVPVWVEYDDWLFEVPIWNPHAGQYANPDMQNIIAMCIAAADVVSVTTNSLYERFNAINKNVVVIPNAYRSDLLPYRSPTPPPRSKDIAWRGSNTHDADILSVHEAWLSLPGKVNFYGGAPWTLTARMTPGSYQIVGSQDPFMYMKVIYEAAPRVFVVPLVDCFFNRCKSNIAYQEALHAGAVCVAPDMPEWNRPGIMNFIPGSSISFASVVREAFEMDDLKHAEFVANGYEKMKGEYDTVHINENRKAVLVELVSPGFVLNDKSPWDQMLGFWAMSQLGLKKPLAAPIGN